MLSSSCHKTKQSWIIDSFLFPQSFWGFSSALSDLSHWHISNWRCGMRKGHHIALFGENVSAMVNHFKNNRCFHSFELDTLFSPFTFLLFIVIRYDSAICGFGGKFWIVWFQMSHTFQWIFIFIFYCYLAVSRINKYPLFSVHQSA